MNVFFEENGVRYKNSEFCNICTAIILCNILKLIQLIYCYKKQLINDWWKIV